MDPSQPAPLEPAGRVGAVAERLAEAQRRYEAARDARAVYVLAFVQMYRALAHRLGGPEPDFDDPVWVADLAVVFADLLFEACDGLDAAVAADPLRPSLKAVPSAWADVFRATASGSSVMEDLVCGLIAHIGHDLPLALARVGLRSGGTSRVRDFHRLNDVLGSITDGVQLRLTRRYSRRLERLDRLAGGLDEAATRLAMRVSRAVAWYTAERLLDPASEAEARRDIETVVARALATIRPQRGRRHRAVVWVVRVVLGGPRRWGAPRSGATPGP